MKCWKETIVQKSKKFNFKSKFLYDGAKNWPPQPRFLNSWLSLLSFYMCDFSKKNSWVQEKLKCWKETIVQKSKKINFKSKFLYDGAKNWPPQPRFLNSWLSLLSIYMCDFSKKTSWVQEKLKCWKETIVQKSKKFDFKSRFLYDGAKNWTPQPRFLNSWLSLLPIYMCNFSIK